MGDYTVIVRCVQGYSGGIQAQLSKDLAHEPMWDANEIPIVVHATKTELLKSIIGLDCPGLLPGGREMVGGEHRSCGHIHAATQLPQGGVAPAGFRKKGEWTASSSLMCKRCSAAAYLS